MTRAKNYFLQRNSWSWHSHHGHGLQLQCLLQRGDQRQGRSFQHSIESSKFLILFAAVLRSWAFLFDAGAEFSNFDIPSKN